MKSDNPKSQKDDIVRVGRFTVFAGGLTAAMVTGTASVGMSVVGGLLLFVFKGGNPMIKGSPFLMGVGTILLIIGVLGFLATLGLIMGSSLFLKKNEDHGKAPKS